MSNITERLDNLKKTIQEDDFLQGKGLSNEVNIRMFCYNVKEEMAVRYPSLEVITMFFRT